MSIKKNESGVVIFYILVGIALFAALSYAFSYNMNTSTNNLTEEESRVFAQDILSYAGRLSRGVERVMSRGTCSENDISFYLTTNPLLNVYIHTPVSADGCKVFHEFGGSITWQTPAKDINDGSDWIFTASNFVHNVGSNVQPDGNDLIAILPYVEQSVCLELNKIVGLKNTTNTPPYVSVNITTTPFTGSFAGTGAINAAGADLRDQKTGCFRAASIDGAAEPNTYHFYHVLIAR